MGNESSTPAAGTPPAGAPKPAAAEDDGSKAEAERIFALPGRAACRRMYDAEVAEIYSYAMAEELPKITDTLDKLLEAIPEGPIVDVACGSGEFLAYFEYKGRGDLHGIDISVPMLKLAHVHAPTARLRKGDMVTLPKWADGSCAAVINWFSVHHVGADEAERAVAEWARVLKPGGMLMLGAWEGEGELPREADGVPADVPMNKFPMEAIVKWVEAAGLKIVASDSKDDEAGAVAFVRAVRPSDAAA